MTNKKTTIAEQMKIDQEKLLDKQANNAALFWGLVGLVCIISLFLGN